MPRNAAKSPYANLCVDVVDTNKHRMANSIDGGPLKPDPPFRKKGHNKKPKLPHVHNGPTRNGAVSMIFCIKRFVSVEGCGDKLGRYPNFRLWAGISNAVE